MNSAPFCLSTKFGVRLTGLPVRISAPDPSLSPCRAFINQGQPFTPIQTPPLKTGVVNSRSSTFANVQLSVGLNSKITFGDTAFEKLPARFDSTTAVYCSVVCSTMQKSRVLPENTAVTRYNRTITVHLLIYTKLAPCW